MIVKVTMQGDRDFRYRIQGESTWITLTANVKHEITFNAAVRVELSSVFKLSTFTMGGDVEDIHLDNTSLTSLNDLAVGIKYLNSVFIRSSENIVSMDRAFKNSGLLSLDVLSNNVTTFKEAFANTTRLSDVTIDTTNAVFVNNMFKSSNVTTISQLSFPFTSSLGILYDTPNAKALGSAIDLSRMDSTQLTTDSFSQNSGLINEYDMTIVHGKILPSVYNKIPSVDVSKDVEISITSGGFDTSKSQIELSNLPVVDITVDVSKDTELTLSTKVFDTSKASIEVQNLSLMASSVDGTMNTELDIVGVLSENLVKEDIVLIERYQFDTTTVHPIFDLVIDASLQ